MIEIMRGIEDLPVIYESPKIISKFYFAHECFMPIHNYPWIDIELLDGELGIIGIKDYSNSFLPILRVCSKEYKHETNQQSA